MEIGKRIRQLREEKGLSANQLSRLVKLTQSQVSKLETGVAQPSLAALMRICDALGVSLAEFFTQESQLLTALPEHLQELMREVKSLSPGQAEQLAKFIAAMRTSPAGYKKRK